MAEVKMIKTDASLEEVISGLEHDVVPVQISFLDLEDVKNLSEEEFDYGHIFHNEKNENLYGLLTIDSTGKMNPAVLRYSLLELFNTLLSEKKFEGQTILVNESSFASFKDMLTFTYTLKELFATWFSESANGDVTLIISIAKVKKGIF